jgi:hypothetical protein
VRATAPGAGSFTSVRIRETREELPEHGMSPSEPRLHDHAGTDGSNVDSCLSPSPEYRPSAQAMAVSIAAFTTARRGSLRGHLGVVVSA